MTENNIYNKLRYSSILQLIALKNNINRCSKNRLLSFYIQEISKTFAPNRTEVLFMYLTVHLQNSHTVSVIHNFPKDFTSLWAKFVSNNWEPWVVTYAVLQLHPHLVNRKNSCTFILSYISRYYLETMHLQRCNCILEV